jgi:cysteinyl-tRNA synthetase
MSKMGLVLYNTLSRKKEECMPQGDTVQMYTCGPTVYNTAHIGNLRSFLFEDILKRVLLYNGYAVNHVMNITDVGHLVSDADTGEDKMEEGSAREGRSVWDIAKFYTDAVMADFGKLNMLPAGTYCRATDNIPEQIALVRKLEQKGCTYIIDDGVYFDTSKFPRYCDFAQLNPEALDAGARVDMVEGKKRVTDFALWKFSPKDKKRQMEWESPWGIGFPGWHIECSAMAMKYLGETLDIHCGGIDHINVHHTNEIAQSEAATGKPFSKYWLHGAFLKLEKEKMAKSGGNFIILKTLEDRGISPVAYRFFCLSAHYRAPLTFSWEIIENARLGYQSLVSKLTELRNKSGGPRSDAADGFRESFKKEINDDLNMPRALAVLWDALKSEALSNRAKLELAEEFDGILGLGIKAVKSSYIDVPEEINALLEARNKAKKEKNWAKADEIRDILSQKGYRIIDTRDGAKVEKA